MSSQCQRRNWRVPDVRLSLTLNLSAPVVLLFMFYFAIVGSIVHILFLPILQYVPFLYYGVLGLVFIQALYVVQYIYLQYYASRARRLARTAIRDGVRPSELITRKHLEKGEMKELDVLELRMKDGSLTHEDLKRIEREMQKRMKKSRGP